MQGFESTSILPFTSKTNVTGLDPTKNYKFAISITGQIIKSMPDGAFLLVESSSGMMWESCVPFINTGMKTIIFFKNRSTFKSVCVNSYIF